MAKGQFHIGRNGPAPCSVDPSNPNSVGCPYGATGHYSTLAEAEAVYAETQASSLFPTTTRANASIRMGRKREDLQHTFDGLVAQRCYGISYDSRAKSYTADDSESLQRFCSELEDSANGELSVHISYDDEAEDVIISVDVPELELEIENQNAEEDRREYFQWSQDRAFENAEYWRSTM